MSSYKISLVVPVYGVERYIRQFAESALSQTYDDLQFVFVNDGTKDRSMEILDELIEEKYSHLKDRIIIINKENGGLPSARKAGLEAAEGEYILFADSDDWLDTDMVSKVMAKADETGADIVYFDLIKEYGHKTSYKREREYTAATKQDFIINIFNYRSHGYTVTKCFRKRLYTDNVIYFPKLGMHEDIYLMTQIIHYAGSLAHLPEGLYHYRKDNSGAMTAQNRKQRHLNSAMNLLDLYEHYRENLAGSPIEKVAGGIIMRAGWHSVRHDLGLFEKYPYLAADIVKAKMSCRYRIPLPMQLYIKLYSWFRKK